MKRLLKADVYQMVKDLDPCLEALDMLEKKVRSKASFDQIWRSFIKGELTNKHDYASWLLQKLGFSRLKTHEVCCFCGDPNCPFQLQPYFRSEAEAIRLYSTKRVLKALVKHFEKP